MTDEDRPGGGYLRSFKQRVAQLLVQRHRTDYDLGRMIEECRTGRYWKWWYWTDKNGNDVVGYPSFSDWCWAVLGFRRRKADMLRENYNNLSPMDLDEQGPTFSRAMRIGWSKLHQVLRVSRDENTLIAWLQVVEDENLSYEELKAKVRWALAEATAASTIGQAREPVNPMDNDSGSSVEGGDPDLPAEPSMPTTRVSVNWPVVFESRTALDTVLQAHRLMQSRYDQDIGLGKAIAMMATSYLATAPRDEEGGAPVEVELMVRAFEENFGVQMQPVSAGATAGVRRRRPLMQ